MYRISGSIEGGEFRPRSPFSICEPSSMHERSSPESRNFIDHTMYLLGLHNSQFDNGFDLNSLTFNFPCFKLSSASS